MKKVLVLAGGFAGLEAAIHLSKGGLDVTLVSNRPYLYIYPTSIWVVTGERPAAPATDAAADKAAYESVVRALMDRQRELGKLRRDSLAKHKTAAALWPTRLESTRAVLDEFESVHGEMVREAQRAREEWDLAQLMRVAAKLKGLAADLRQLPGLPKSTQ